MRKFKSFYFEDIAKTKKYKNINYIFAHFFGNLHKLAYYFDRNLSSDTETVQNEISNTNKNLLKSGLNHTINWFSDKELISVSKIIKYQFPFIDTTIFKHNSKNNILQAFEIHKFERGLIVIDFDFIEIIENIEGNFKDFISEFYFEYLIKIEKHKQTEENHRKDNFPFMASEKFNNDYFNFYKIPPNETAEERQLRIANQIAEKTEWDIANELDEKTAEKIENIQRELFDLKQNANFYLVAPFLQKILKDNPEISPISKLIITKDFEIVLSDYNNTKIHLSHLTKAIYFLFLKYPVGLQKKPFRN